MQEGYELSWDYFDNTVKYKELALPHTEDVIHDINKLNALQRKMQQRALSLNHTSCKMKVTDQLNGATSKFAANAMKHYNSLTNYASCINIHDYAEKVMTTQSTKLMDMHVANHCLNI